MRQLDFRFETTLSFSSNVTDHHFALHILPASDDVQTIQRASVTVEPAAPLTWHTDCFGNRYCSGCLSAAHDSFTYRCEGRAVIGDGPRMEPLNPIYRFPTPLTQPDPAIAELFRANRTDSPDRMARAMGWFRLVQRLLAYLPGSTTVTTTAAEALAQGKGVCQDYAQLLLAFCRLDGIPARYVAGLPLGDGETHAWVDIYSSGGWYGLDPTRDTMADDRYIQLCHGRDACDCTIERGLMRGNASQTQTVYMQVQQ